MRGDFLADDVVERPDDRAAEEGADGPREGVATPPALGVAVDQDGHDERDGQGEQQYEQGDQEFDAAGDGELQERAEHDGREKRSAGRSVRGF